MSGTHPAHGACGHDHSWVGGGSGPRPAVGIALQGVSILRNGTPAVDGVTCDLPAATLTAILGPNGAGKTTLLRGILGELPLAAGNVRIAGERIATAAARLAWLPQRAAIDWDFPLTVREVVAQGRCRVRRWWEGFGQQDEQAVAAALAEMGLGGLEDRGIARLSGGQQQRVLIARALATGADALLLDEPLAGLDPAAAEDLVHALDAAAGRGRTILIAAHDLALVQAHIANALLLNRSLIAAGPTATVLTEAHLRSAFGDRALGGVLHALHAHGGTQL